MSTMWRLRKSFIALPFIYSYSNNKGSNDINFAKGDIFSDIQSGGVDNEYGLSHVKRIILVRPGQSIKDVDIRTYCHESDWRIPLTKQGEAQAVKFGKVLKNICGNEPVQIYFSPFLRALQFMRLTCRSALNLIHDSTGDKLNIIGIGEDAYLRNGDIGGFPGGIEQLKRVLEEQEKFGKFFYRFPNGESPANVGDRITAFLDFFREEEQKLPNDTNVVLITHHVPIQLFVKRWFRLNVDTFNNMKAPKNGEHVIFERIPESDSSNRANFFKLNDDAFEALNLPVSLTATNGYAFRNKRVVGSVSSGAPYL